MNEEMVTNSFIYRYKDIIIKKYCIEYAISDDIFDILSTTDSKHLIRLYELFTIISQSPKQIKEYKFTHSNR